MAANLVWYEADGVTPLGAIQWGIIPPGESYHGLHAEYMEMVLKNTGDVTTSVTLEIRPSGATNAHEHARIAIGEVAPGTFYDEGSPIDVGDLPAAGTVRVWVDMIVPALAPMADTASIAIAAVGS